MDVQPDFERSVNARLDQIQADLASLSMKVDGLYARDASRESGVGRSNPVPQRFELPKPRPSAGTQSSARPAVQKASPENGASGFAGRSVDWWLARAGAALTVFAVILLYRYAISEGWITPAIRVLIGVLIGAGLMYYGRRMAVASDADPAPTALRELTMGAGLAAWYVSAFVVSATYHLIPISASRFLFLGLSILGAVLSLKERRSTLAIIAIGAGFLGPVLLDAGPSVPAFALYLAVLGSLAIVLYLMRGWQSVLWISFVALGTDIAGMISLVQHSPDPRSAAVIPVSLFDSGRLIVTLLIVASLAAFTRAPSMRRQLAATNSDLYPQPVRSLFATNWLNEMLKLVKMFSPAAESLDSPSLWAITIIAPVAGAALMAELWPVASNALWGAILLVLAVVAYRMCESGSETDETTHLKGTAAFVWAAAGATAIGYALLPSNSDAVTLGVAAMFAASAISFLPGQRFAGAIAAARLTAGVCLIAVVFTETMLLNTTAVAHVDRLQIALSVAELVTLVAGVLAWREMTRSAVADHVSTLIAVMTYGAFLMVDSRILGQILPPLVTASFAIVGTVLLFISRKGDNRLLRTVGGATLAFVILRLLFVDLVGVDTIWRVLLFLGCGALFLYTSRQLQNARTQEASEPT